MATNNNINLAKPVSAFEASNAANQLNVTGDGTIYTVQFTSEVFDNASNFDATSTFTAPRDGLYMFYVIISEATNLVANNTKLWIVADSVTYRLVQIDYSSGVPAAGNLYIMSRSILCSMTAGSTAQVFLQTSGTARTNGISGTVSGYQTPIFSTQFLTGLI